MLYGLYAVVCRIRDVAALLLGLTPPSGPQATTLSRLGPSPSKGITAQRAAQATMTSVIPSPNNTRLPPLIINDPGAQKISIVRRDID